MEIDINTKNMMEKEYLAPFPMITASTSANEKFSSFDREKETKTVESASSIVITPKCTKH